jgi:hypothetical protein
MKALTCHGKEDVRIDTVPDPPHSNRQSHKKPHKIARSQNQPRQEARNCREDRDQTRCRYRQRPTHRWLPRQERRLSMFVPL